MNLIILRHLGTVILLFSFHFKPFLLFVVCIRFETTQGSLQIIYLFQTCFTLFLSDEFDKKHLRYHTTEENQSVIRYLQVFIVFFRSLRIDINKDYIRTLHTDKYIVKQTYCRILHSKNHSFKARCFQDFWNNWIIYIYIKLI